MNTKMDEIRFGDGTELFEIVVPSPCLAQYHNENFLSRVHATLLVTTLVGCQLLLLSLIMGKSLSYFNLKDAPGNNIVYTEQYIILNTRKNLLVRSRTSIRGSVGSSVRHSVTHKLNLRRMG